MQMTKETINMLRTDLAEGTFLFYDWVMTQIFIIVELSYWLKTLCIVKNHLKTLCSDSEVDGKTFRSDDLSSTDKCNRYLSEDQSKKNLRLGPAFSSFPSGDFRNNLDSSDLEIIVWFCVAAALANSSVIVSTPSPGMSDTDMKSKNANPSPYTFFTMESDDDFDFDGGDKSFEVMDDHPRFGLIFYCQSSKRAKKSFFIISENLKSVKISIKTSANILKDEFWQTFDEIISFEALKGIFE